MATRKTRTESTVRLLAIALLLGAVACGPESPERRDANADPPPVDETGTPAATEDPASTAGSSGVEDGGGEAAAMPELVIDRQREPAPAALPPVGELLEARGGVASWPQAAGSRVRAAVEMQVAEGFHVNANPATEDWIIPTEIDLRDAPGIRLIAIHYPPAQAIDFDFWSAPLDVWEGNPVAGLVLEVAADAEPGARTARLVVRYQACNDEACFRPAEAIVPLPLEIAPAGTETRSLESPLLRRAPFPEE